MTTNIMTSSTKNHKPALVSLGCCSATLAGDLSIISSLWRGRRGGGGRSYDPIIFLKSTRVRLTLFHPTLSQWHSSSAWPRQPTESPAAWRAEPTAGRLSCRQQSPKYLIKQPICHQSLTVEHRIVIFLFSFAIEFASFETNDTITKSQLYKVSHNIECANTIAVI